MDAAYNKGYSTTIILDNGITAMTGQQDHPEQDIRYKMSRDHDQLRAAARAVGIKHVRKVDPYKVDETMEVIRER